MKILSSLILVIVIWLFLYSVASGQEEGGVISKELNKELKEQEKLDLKNSHRRIFIKSSLVYTKLKTTATFSAPTNILSVTLSLEDNLGLADKNVFFTGSFLYRITPRSGINGEYYGLNRSNSHTTTQELIIMNDTIPEGTRGNAYFNTQVFSLGYLLSILKDPTAFLGFYFNVYGMMINTGFSVENQDYNPNFSFIAPLPSFGIVTLFKLNKWLQIHGDVGFFNIQINTFGGSMYSFDLALDFKPVQWLGISMGYKGFDVNIHVPEDEVNTTINYNFRGPSLGWKNR